MAMVEVEMNNEKKGSTMRRLLCLLILMTALIFINGQHCPDRCMCKIEEGNLNVYCNNTGRVVIPKDVPREAVSLDVGENNLQGVHVGDLQGLDNLTFLSLGQNGFRGNEIEKGALELPKLNSIDLSGNIYKAIPPNLPSQLVSLYFGGNPIESIDTLSFRNYTYLVVIDLSYTLLMKIFPHSLDMLPHLATVDFSFTPIANPGIPDDLFVKNTNLITLSLRLTNITSPLRNLPSSLQNLDYVGDNIQVIPSYVFQTLHNLQVFELFENHVTTIEDNAFEGLDKLTILDFMDGKISSVITKNTLSGLKSLRTVYFDDNLIPKIEAGALHDLQNLDSLWLSGNKLRTLDEGVLDPKHVPKLSTLYIDFNPWYCDCNLKWLREKVNNASYTIMDPHIIICDGPPKVAGKGWDVLKPDDFIC